MNRLFLVCLLLLTSLVKGQEYEKEILKFREEINIDFKNSEDSPLTDSSKISFTALPFFPADEKYRLTADFERVNSSAPFQMKTTTDRLPTYQVFGIATFVLDEIEYKLNIYQNLKLIESEEYMNYLFLPFTDYTNGNESYGGGRYIDLEIPNGDTIILDFNKSYNPYCAYNKKYSCPIPPEENAIAREIPAGVKYD